MIDPEATAVRFRGGGSLDGLAMELPADARSVVTVDRKGQSFYVVDGAAGTAAFVGFNNGGKAMAGIMRQFTEAAKAEREAIEAASRAVGCSACGRTFANAAAKVVHADQGRCLPDTAYGQLVNVDGIWDSAWRHPQPPSVSGRTS